MSTRQAPIGSGFGAVSTAAEVIRGMDLFGRVAIVTGGYSGIGLETTRALRSVGAKVIIRPVLRVFVHPTLIHFICVLFLATIIMIPTLTRRPLGVLLEVAPVSWAV